MPSESRVPAAIHQTRSRPPQARQQPGLLCRHDAPLLGTFVIVAEQVKEPVDSEAGDLLQKRDSLIPRLFLGPVSGNVDLARYQVHPRRRWRGIGDRFGPQR